MIQADINIESAQRLRAVASSNVVDNALRHIHCGRVSVDLAVDGPYPEHLPAHNALNFNDRSCRS
jgi:hypothetical protein